MPSCPTCQSMLADDAVSCSRCGSQVGTLAMSHSDSSPSRTRPAVEAEEDRFFPGTLIAERYRIISRIGRGGMGEVYRATDIRLAQTVALKFLPEAMAHEPSALARFHAEVRIARQVTHPNVCRVYDIGEYQGQPFLSMEFVDGENLASLLRRIGRLPADKAVEIARRLCAGLAAAHNQGVLHRDLKPANIMIDGRGQVLITDFGLAGIADEIQGAEVRNGTPAYMAPEQLNGTEVSIKSDIYALGLVLYEMFTGKRAYEAETLAELKSKRAQADPISISTVVRDIDPAVERVIATCLDRDPRKRPSSALAVSAALPGGDLLAEALAAGETPSPEMVAAAGSQEGMRPLPAVACAAFIVIGFLTVLWIHSGLNVISFIDLEKPPETLAVEARDLARRLGFETKPNDRAWGIDYDYSYFGYVDKHRPATGPPITSTPSPITFWYRESPAMLLADTVFGTGVVTQNTPEQTTVGMLRLTLDPYGRLRSLEAVTPQYLPQPAAQRPLDAASLFGAAGLDLSSFKPADPLYRPPTTVDTRAAWTGPYPGRQDLNARVEAGSLAGKPVYFFLAGPWTPTPPTGEQPNSRMNLGQILQIALQVVSIVAGALLAWRNVRMGRGDRQGAFRLGVVGATLTFLKWVLTAHHVSGQLELSLIDQGLEDALYFGAQLWIAYLALEPYIRRRWPSTIITWSRLFTGRRRDPLVGRDILVGLAFSVVYSMIFMLAFLYLQQQGSLPGSNGSISSLVGYRRMLGDFVGLGVNAVWSSFRLFLVFFLLRLVLRKDWLASAGMMILYGAINGLRSGAPYVLTPAHALIYLLVVVILLRYGILALMVCIMMTNLMLTGAFSTNFSAWYGASSVLALIVVIGATIYAFRMTTSAQSLVGRWLEA
ncbi:MAG TPA: serine/threonine-protein kinase [Bryobacteraceae bacterium]|nr:serine/threonine-protein kinase [Bryobacteraceae bacterium]